MTDHDYYDALIMRAGDEVAVQFRPGVVFRNGSEPNCAACHVNVDKFVAENPGCKPARGFYFGEMPLFDNHYLIQAHSVVDEHGSLVDITPIAPGEHRPRFLRHLGSEAQFEVLKRRAQVIWPPVG